MKKFSNLYYAMRHGESEANAAGLIISSPENGIPAYGLTAKGRRECLESASAFSGGAEISLIYSSDFKRAAETAQIMADYFKIPAPVYTELLRERFFGVLEGGPDSHYGEVWAEDGTGTPGSFGAEPSAAAAARAMELVRNCEIAHSGKGILFVSHGDILQILEAVLSGLPPEKHRSLRPLSRAEIRRLA